MLSSIGRAAIKRVVAGGPESTNRALQTIWQLQRVALSQHTSDASTQSNVLFGHMRLYATTTKAAPKSKTSSKTTAKPKAKKAPLRKAAAKKPVKKPVKKTRATTKKKLPRKSSKKILTKEQEKRAELRELKAKALKPPLLKPRTTWVAFIGEEVKRDRTLISGGKMGELATRYKALTPSELESLNHAVNANKAANEVTYKKWIDSHTPDEIRIANNARTQLKKKFKLPAPPLIDPRLPKRPTSSRLFYNKERFESGDLKGISLAESAVLLAKEWESLPASDKKKYDDQSAEDKARYVQEYKTVYHRDSSSKLA